jgi:hypothetical protein
MINGNPVALTDEQRIKQILELLPPTPRVFRAQAMLTWRPRDSRSVSRCGPGHVACNFTT